MANHSPVKDSGGFFQIDPATRLVKVPSDQKALGAVGDHLSEQKTFVCPQIIDGHDVAGCARKYVTWKNVDGELGHDELQVLKVEDGQLYLTWTIRDATTVAKGLVRFSVHFEDLSEDGTRITYRWGTHTNENCEILDSINAVMGAYKAIYLDGETLVFADYTPVHEETLELRTGILPRDTLEITERGKFDVAAYAYVDNNTLGEPIILTVENGVVKASANGREGELPLESPTISVSGTGLIKSSANGLTQQVQLKGAMLTNVKADNIKKGIKVLDVTGTYDPVEGTAPTIDIEAGYVIATANGQTTQVLLETPSISIEEGVVTATANELTDTHTLVAADVPGLTPDVIAKDVTVLDVVGVYDPVQKLNCLVPLKATSGAIATGQKLKAYWTVLLTASASTLTKMEQEISASKRLDATVAKGTFVIFEATGGTLSIARHNVTDLTPVCVDFGYGGTPDYIRSTTPVIFRVTGDNPSILLNVFSQ